jgi:glycosyltransferase involved in cell wall biosynthesis
LGIINIPVYEIQAPVDSAFFNPVAERGIDMHFLKKSGLNIVSVGNINPLKGYEYFIKMAAALKDNRDLNFYIVGPELKSQRRYYRKLVNMKKDLGVENLYFYGMSDSIYNILLETDVYVCCSISEASPTSVWEAMSMAKPVLCTDVGDVALMLKDGESGFIVPCGDVDLLVERLKILVKDSEVRKQFGEKARGAVLKKLDIKNVVKLHQELYTKTIGRCVH